MRRSVPTSPRAPHHAHASCIHFSSNLPPFLTHCICQLVTHVRANKIASIAPSTNSPYFGVPFTVTVVGNTGTISNALVMFFAPATDPAWNAAAFALVSTMCRFYTPPANVSMQILIDQLYLQPAGTDYTCTCMFVPVGLGSSAISTLNFISSGTNVKFTSAPPQNIIIAPPINCLTVSAVATPACLTVIPTASNLTVTFVNSCAGTAALNTLIINGTYSVASSPGTTSLSTGAAIADPTAALIQGVPQLQFYGIVVPSSGAVVLKTTLLLASNGSALCMQVYGALFGTLIGKTPAGPPVSVICYIYCSRTNSASLSASLYFQ